MKPKILLFENIANMGGRWKNIGVQPSLGQAYLYSLEAGNEIPNFGEVIWDNDVEAILADCRRFGIKEFTISSTFSGVIATLARFENLGCKMEGLVKINSKYEDFDHPGHKEKIPAFKMTIQ